MKTTKALILCASLLFPVSALGQQKIGFVDLQDALNKVDEGKKAKAVLEQDYKKKKEDLEATRAKLVAMDEELKRSLATLSEEERRTKEEELATAVKRYETDKATAYESWQKREASLSKDLLQRILVVVQQIGKERGYTVVLEKDNPAVLYAAGEDLTREVIEKFNKTGGR